MRRQLGQMIVSIMNHLDGEAEAMQWARGNFIVAHVPIARKRKRVAVRRILWANTVCDTGLLC